jgi:hypothetical protein
VRKPGYDAHIYISDIYILDTVCIFAITWNSQGQRRRRGRPEIPWQRSVDSEMREMSLSWGWLERLAQDKDAWRALVGGLCTCKRVEGR